MRKQNVSITKVEPATTPVKLELSGPVRKPTLTEKNNFFKQITFDPKCPICAEVVWNEDTHKDPNMKQKLFARHAFKNHLMEEMKVCQTFLDFFISLITIRCFQIFSSLFCFIFQLALLNCQIEKDVSDILRCPYNLGNHNGGCKVTTQNYFDIVMHFVSEHGMTHVIEPFWQLLYFKTTLLTEELNNPVNDDGIKAMCDKFSDEELIYDENGRITITMKMATKLKKVGLKKTVIQPAACFALR